MIRSTRRAFSGGDERIIQRILLRVQGGWMSVQGIEDVYKVGRRVQEWRTCTGVEDVYRGCEGWMDGCAYRW